LEQFKLKSGISIKNFGLIGYPLGHSFSAKYFKQKFEDEKLNGYNYNLYELEDLSNVRNLAKKIPKLIGLNVTIPHKTSILNYLDEIDLPASEIGAVNCIRIKDGVWKGYNTDAIGFRTSLYQFLEISKNPKPKKSLILGNGGSSKAVQWVLKNEGFVFYIASRTPGKSFLKYEQISNDFIRDIDLIINTTPLGMFPDVDHAPMLPYNSLSSKQMLMDLIYNPDKTLFLRLGNAKNCKIMNGMQMLIEQAEASWKIWNF
jgi:shikimate dehydrogenase